MIREQTLHDLQKTMEFLYHEVLCPWICSSVSWFIVCGNLTRICTLLLCENCINLNCVELLHRGFQAYYILLLFCLFILLIFESLILKFQLKIVIYLKIQLHYIMELYVTLFYIFPFSYKCYTFII